MKTALYTPLIVLLAALMPLQQSSGQDGSDGAERSGSEQHSVFSVPGEQDAVDDPNERLKRDEDLKAKIDSMDSVFEAWDNADTPGCAVGVSRDGRKVVERAWGMADLENPVRNTPSTIFEAGSVSKQFVTAPVILLHLEGKLDLDDDVREYVPELPDYDHTITLRNLMNHTSGLRDWGSVAAISGWGRSSRTHDHDHVADILSRQQKLNFPPGERYSYSNSGYNLLAIIVTRVTGQPFAEFSQERIFDELGMTSTQWRDDYTRVVENRSAAYSGSEGDETFSINRPIEHVHGNGGLLTTVGDLLTWNHALDSEYFGEEFNELMHERGVLNSGRAIHYASGIRYGSAHGQQTIGHTGATSGYRAFLSRFMEEDLSVAMLCNVTGVSTSGMGNAVAGLFLRDPADPDEPAEPEGVNVSRDRLEQLAGIYADEHNHRSTQLEVEDGVLKANGTELTPLSESEFRVGSSDTRYVFESQGRTGNYRIQIHREGHGEEWLLPAEEADEDAMDLSRYTGTYESPDAETTVKITEEDGELVLHRRPDSEFTLNPVYKDAFSGFGMLRFFGDDGDQADEFAYSSGRVYDLRFYRKD